MVWDSYEPRVFYSHRCCDLWSLKILINIILLSQFTWIFHAFSFVFISLKMLLYCIEFILSKLVFDPSQFSLTLMSIGINNVVHRNQFFLWNHQEILLHTWKLDNFKIKFQFCFMSDFSVKHPIGNLITVSFSASYLLLPKWSP